LSYVNQNNKLQWDELDRMFLDKEAPDQNYKQLIKQLVYPTQLNPDTKTSDKEDDVNDRNC